MKNPIAETTFAKSQINFTGLIPNKGKKLSTWLVDYGVHLPYSMGNGRNLLRIIKVETRDPETGKWVEGKLKGANGKSRIFSK